MIQQINLYLPELRGSKDPLTAVLIGQVLAGVTAVLFLLTAYNLFHRLQLNSELSDLNATLAEERANTEALSRELAGRAQDGSLTQRLSEAEARLESRRQIRNFLNETQLGNVVGFSEYFKDLSRASVEGLSISSFTFDSGGADVQISGRVANSALVPRYVTNLQQGNSPLRSKRFSPSISRSDLSTQVFNFTLSSAQ